MLRIAAFAVTLAAMGPAAAADFNPPAPVASPTPAFSWSGPYAGLALGYGWASANQTYSISSATLAAAPPIIPVIDASGSRQLEPRGPLYDADVGYLWQSKDGFVFGVEGDLAATGVRGVQNNGGNIPNYPPGYPYSIAQKLAPEVQAEIRAKFGYTPTDQTLVYMIGGPAFALLRYTSAFTDIWAENEGVSLTTWRPGWTLGAGGEYAISAHWSVKAEYAYAQFLPATGQGSTVLTDGTTAYAAHSTGIVKENSLRVGINYHF